MLSPEILKVDVEDQTEASGKRFYVTLRCSACGDRYSFMFTARDAGIHAHYMAEDIARNYALRCAPLRCGECTINPPL